MAEGLAQGAAHVLEMMHPMREPPQPTSLLPFFVTLALGCGAAVILLGLVARARRRRADLREAALAALARTRTLAPAERLAAQAALLRRLVRRIAGDDAMRTQGRAWLESLDAVFATRFFTQGAGVAFGDALYATQVPDVDALDAALAELFANLRTKSAVHPSPLAGEGGAKRRKRGARRLVHSDSASGNPPSSDPASPGHLLPQGEKG